MDSLNPERGVAEGRERETEREEAENEFRQT